MLRLRLIWDSCSVVIPPRNAMKVVKSCKIAQKSSFWCKNTSKLTLCDLPLKPNRRFLVQIWCWVHWNRKTGRKTQRKSSEMYFMDDWEAKNVLLSAVGRQKWTLECIERLLTKSKWFNSTKRGLENGLPSKCIEHTHNRSEKMGQIGPYVVPWLWTRWRKP